MTEMEAFAVVLRIKKFEPYLYGRKFIFHTLNHPLKWLMPISDPIGRLARCSLLLQQYDFEVKHHSGTANANADALYRRPYAISAPSISAFDAPGVQTFRVRELQRNDPDLSDFKLVTMKLPNWPSKVSLIVGRRLFPR